MLQRIREDVRIILIALIVSAAYAGAPAIADGVRHALFAHKAGVANNSAKLQGNTTNEILARIGTTDLGMNMSGSGGYGTTAASYTFVADNHGSRVSRNVRVSIKAPGDWAETSRTTTRGRCYDDVGGFATNCAIGVLDPDQTMSVTVNYTVPPCASGGDGIRAIVTEDPSFDLHPEDDGAGQPMSGPPYC